MTDASTLSSKDRATLRGRAHALKPVAQIGKEGLEPAVIAGIEQAIAARELVKVKIGRTCPLEPKIAAQRLATALDAELVGLTGFVAVLFRAKREDVAPPPAR